MSAVAPVGMKQVAQRAGVSIGTVSNVLNRPHLVAGATRERVQLAMAELGYIRNESARQLRAGHSRFIGLVVLDVSNPFFADVARGAEAASEDAGYQVSLWNSGEDRDRERRHLEILLEQRVEGVLITPLDEANPQLDDFVSRGIPVVLVDRGSGSEARCSVAVNDELGGRLAMRHLLEQGHREIAFVGGPFSIEQVEQRYLGAAAELAEHGGAAPLPTVEVPALRLAAGRAAVEGLLAMQPLPTAVFCANDLIALGVLRGCVERGLAVPDDLAIVGYDDIEFAASAAVPLSSVRQPREELGREAVELLLDELADRGHRHRQILFTPSLEVRASSAPARTAQPHAVATGK